MVVEVNERVNQRIGFFERSRFVPVKALGFKDGEKFSAMALSKGFRCDEVPVPAPHEDELLVRVGACSICGSDLPRVFDHGSGNGKYPLI